MKTLILSFLLAVPALASSVSTDKDTIRVSTLTSVKTSTEPLCPEGVTCIANGTIVNMTFTLPGCVDKLGPVNYKLVKMGKKNILYVSAQALQSSRSKVVMCFAPNFQTATATFIGVYGIEVQLLKDSAQNNIDE